MSQGKKNQPLKPNVKHGYNDRITSQPDGVSANTGTKAWSCWVFFLKKDGEFGHIQIQNQSVSELLLLPLRKSKRATRAHVDVPRTSTLCDLGITPHPRRLGSSPTWTERGEGPSIHLQPFPGTFAHGRVSCPNSSLSPAGLPPPFAFSIAKSFIG